MIFGLQPYVKFLIIEVIIIIIKEQLSNREILLGNIFQFVTNSIRRIGFEIDETNWTERLEFIYNTFFRFICLKCGRQNTWINELTVSKPLNKKSSKSHLENKIILVSLVETIKYQLD